MVSENRPCRDALAPTRRPPRGTRSAAAEPPALTRRFSHDLRNLFTAVMGHVELAALDLPPDHPARRQLKMIELAIRRGNELADSIRRFAHSSGADRPWGEFGWMTPDQEKRDRQTTGARPSTTGSTMVRPTPDRSVNAKSSRSGSGRPVLLVENNDHVRAIMVSALRAQGYAPVSVSSGVEAVERLRPRCAEMCLVVLDLDLPEEDVRSCLRELCRSQRDVPVIFLGGETECEHTAPLAGTGHRLVKPFSPTELEETVARVLAAPRSARSKAC